MALDNITKLAEARSKKSGGGGEVKATGGKPIIRVEVGELAKTIRAVDDAVLSTETNLYQMGKELVQVLWIDMKARNGEKVMQLSTVKAAGLRVNWSNQLVFEKWSSTAEAYIQCDPPGELVESYLAMAGALKLPVIVGITTCPLLRHDGTIFDEPGYDEVSGMLFDPQGVEYPKIKDRPTKEDAEYALKTLEYLVEETAFGDDVDKSVAISSIMTATIRRGLPVAPMHAYNAPEAASGKSTMVNIACMIATGHKASIYAAGKGSKGAEELDKKIAAALMAGESIISIDNVATVLDSDLLCQCLTEEFVSPRILGQSVIKKVNNKSMFFATGNGFVVEGDLTRRILVSTINTNLARPELKEFQRDPIQMVQDKRPDYVTAVLTIIRAYMQSGETRSKSPLASYKEWCDRVREPLIWLGLQDPVLSMDRSKADDPNRSVLEQIIGAWAIWPGLDRPLTSKSLVVEAEATISDDKWTDISLYDALLVVSKNAQGTVDPSKVGYWVRANKGRLVTIPGIGDVTIVSRGATGGVQRWALTKNGARTAVQEEWRFEGGVE